MIDETYDHKQYDEYIRLVRDQMSSDADAYKKFLAERKEIYKAELSKLAENNKYAAIEAAKQKD